jgi:pimeloyl-ACP methyl ester carboxylesterase
LATLPNIVLVHGAWADGSSWSAVIEHLQVDGYRVIAPQFPVTMADDIARLRQVLARQNGPTVVAGHSHGGQIITARHRHAQRRWPGLHRRVRAGRGRVDRCAAEPRTTGSRPGASRRRPAELRLAARGRLRQHFAADVDPVKAKVMFAVQQPLHSSALEEVMSVPAW